MKMTRTIVKISITFESKIKAHLNVFILDMTYFCVEHSLPLLSSLVYFQLSENVESIAIYIWVNDVYCNVSVQYYRSCHRAFFQAFSQTMGASAIKSQIYNRAAFTIHHSLSL